MAAPGERRGRGLSGGRPMPSVGAIFSSDLFGEVARGGDLAAEHREQWRGAGVAERVEFEDIVARDRLGFAGAVVIERANAGPGRGDVGRGDLAGEMLVRSVAEIGDLARRRSPRPRDDRPGTSVVPISVWP